MNSLQLQELVRISEATTARGNMSVLVMLGILRRPLFPPSSLFLFEPLSSLHTLLLPPIQLFLDGELLDLLELLIAEFGGHDRGGKLCLVGSEQTRPSIATATFLEK